MSGGALDGLKVIDLSRVLGGPYCTQILGDHGADVIKIEPPQGDETRDWGPPFQDGLSAYFSGVNRNKRSLALDVGSEAGRAVLLRLLDGADVLIENFKSGTMEKWGLGYDAVLAKRFPRLIHCRITGFGGDGPMGGFPGYDAMVQAWTGLIAVNGPAAGDPVRLGVPVVDLGTGLNAAIGILMAVNERHRSGKGQFLEVTLYDAAIALLHPHAPNWFMSGKPPRRAGNAHPNIVPYDLYPTKTRLVLIGAGNDPQFRKLCEVLGRPDLGKDARFKTNQDRNANRAALDKELRALVAETEGEELAMRLMQAGVPAGAALEVPDVLEHPHAKHREMTIAKDGYRGTGMPVKLARTKPSLRRLPPQFGADGRAVLAEAGYAKAEIDSLIAAGTVAETRRTR
ncbi:MAG: CoA transferase [Alphaproteobacteria bacterium]|nr:CoA transferase [Alphaproteobacteria bacterium]